MQFAAVLEQIAQFLDARRQCALLARPDVDRAEVRGYFERHGLRERFDEILATL